MAKLSGARVKPPEPVFEEPWHAQVFAVTVALNEAGHFTWLDWASRFSSILAAHGIDRDLNGGSDYFAAWLEALEGFLGDLGLIDPDMLEALRGQWKAAYLATPHGKPVQLGD